jgi:hypothetical protein
MARHSAARPDRELARLIRRSRTLTPVLKRQWLTVLPHLSPEDQLRLRQILDSEQQPAQTPTEPAAGPG